MIRRYVLHLEFHRGYRPRLSLRRAPRPGDRVVDGGQPGTLVACPECSGQGLLHLADEHPAPGVAPATAGRTDAETVADVREMVHRLRVAQGGGLSMGYALARITSVLDGERPASAPDLHADDPRQGFPTGRSW